MTLPITPVISATGMKISTFAETLAFVQNYIRSIYGADVFIDPDSQDGQMIGLWCLSHSEACAAMQATFNSYSPSTAQGNGLSSVVKINGLARDLPSNSTCDVTIVGVATTIITNGLVTDASDNDWALPASVTIPSGGSITVTATCTKPGAITASASTLTKIKTAIFGWQTVTNAAPATPGAPVETDPALRLRQSRSVAQPSTTIFEGIMASIAGINGVTRSWGYENNGNTADTNGVPAHSGAIFVEGGDQNTILQTLAHKASPGFGLVGGITGTIIDTSGSSRVVGFARPTNANIKVNLTVKALPGWSATIIEPIIAKALADYINTLQIGQNVHYFDLPAVAKISTSAYASAFLLQAMTIAKNAGSFGSTDLTIAYNEVPFGDPVNVAFTVT